MANGLGGSEARDVLRSLDYRGRRPVGELSDNYARRIASGMLRQIQAGLPPDAQVARGHGRTPERRGGRAPAKVSASEVARIAREPGRGTLHVREIARQAGRAYRAQEIGSAARFDAAYSQLVRRAPGSPVVITARVGGEWRTLSPRGGMRHRDWLRLRTQAGSAEGAIRELIRRKYPQRELDEAELEMETVGLFTTPERADLEEGEL